MAAEDTFLNPIAPILHTWNLWAEAAKADQLWGDDRNPARNVIMDSETLLTLLWPEATLGRLRLKSVSKGRALAPESTAVGEVLGRLSNIDDFDVDERRFYPDVRQKLLQVFGEYFERHAGEGRPSFAAGSYLFEDEVPSWGEAIEVTDAYTFSLTASLTMLRLLDRWFPPDDSAATDRAAIERVRELASERLTASMQGLIDSFAVYQIDDVVFKKNTTMRFPMDDEEISRIRLRLRQLKPDIDVEDSAFEIGWSWGPVSPDDRVAGNDDREYGVYAVPAPYLYFTVGAVDGISDLFDEAVVTSDIFNSTQTELSQMLRVLYDLTVRYWAALAVTDRDDGRWAVENLPWATSDADASEYWTLYLLRVVLRRLEDSEHDSGRLLALVQELAQRGRITRVPVPPKTDGAIDLHWPGKALELEAADGNLPEGETLKWYVYDYSPQLLKLAGQLLGRVRSHKERAELQSLISRVWDHMMQRRDQDGVSGWDSLKVVFDEWHKNKRAQHKRKTGSDDYFAAREPREFQLGSWYVTERMMEALVAVADGEAARPQVPVELMNLLFELIGELDYKRAKKATLAGEDHDQIQETRRRLHEARELLLARRTIDAYEKVAKLLADIG